MSNSAAQIIGSTMGYIVFLVGASILIALGCWMLIVLIKKIEDLING